MLASAWRIGRAMPTTISISGSSSDFAPLHTNENATRFQRWFNDSEIDKALLQHGESAMWCQMANAEVLHITIVGVSVTAGCGAIGSGNRRCVAHLGWARRVADSYRRLAKLAANDVRMLPRVEWSIWPKNAAPVRFWLQCTQSNFELSNKTNVILIETEPTLDPADERDVRQLVAQLRRAAPNAALGFVMWPSQWQQAQARRAVEKVVQGLSKREDFDVASASILLAAATRVGQPAQTFYDDPVHPNPDGHAMLAGLVSAWLFKRLTNNTGCNSVPSAGAPADSPLGAKKKNGQLPAAAFERCYPRADAIPVVDRCQAGNTACPGFELRDEGGAKGVPKMGFVSERLGETLLLGPILPEARCGMFEVSLGFLVSWQHAQGALDVNCTGSCGCMPMHHYRWQKQRDHEPFPRLQTWTRAGSSLVQGTLANASTTAYTRFLLVKSEAAGADADPGHDPSPPESCTIRVTHLRGESVRETTSSRVRIDGLSLKQASCQTHCIALRHASNQWGRARLEKLRASCRTSSLQGLEGSFSPHCVGCNDAA